MKNKVKSVKSPYRLGFAVPTEDMEMTTPNTSSPVWHLNMHIQSYTPLHHVECKPLKMAAQGNQTFIITIRC